MPKNNTDSSVSKSISINNSEGNDSNGIVNPSLNKRKKADQKAEKLSSNLDINSNVNNDLIDDDNKDLTLNTANKKTLIDFQSIKMDADGMLIKAVEEIDYSDTDSSEDEFGLYKITQEHIRDVVKDLMAHPEKATLVRARVDKSLAHDDSNSDEESTNLKIATSANDNTLPANININITASVGSIRQRARPTLLNLGASIQQFQTLNTDSSTNANTSKLGSKSVLKRTPSTLNGFQKILDDENKNKKVQTIYSKVSKL